LNTTRALISLIDQNNQHCLAEATQISTLQPGPVHSNLEELWFGCATLPRSLGLCEMAIEILPAKDGSHPASWKLSPLIVNDLTLDDKFKHHPFVTARPSLRFYATIPIRTRSGFNIGAISVMHDRPREGLNEGQLAFLDDIAITIMAYLEVARVKEEHRRSEKILKGLGVFVEGGSSLREWWLDTKINEAWGQQDSKHGTEPQSTMKHKSEPDSDSMLTLAERISASRTVEAKVVDYFEAQHRPLHRPSAKQAVDCEHYTKSEHTIKPFAANLQESRLSANLEDVFSRASNIIQECIDVDGTIFLDANVSTFGGHGGELHTKFEQLESNLNRNQESTTSNKQEMQKKTRASHFRTLESSTNSSDSDQLSMEISTKWHDEKQNVCRILGLSVPELPNLGCDRASESYISVTQRFLQRLLRKYPRGQVFDLYEGDSLIPKKESILQSADLIKSGSESPRILSSRRRREGAKQRDAKAILQMFPGAHSVIFSPLWDSRRGQWFAGSFGWTTRSTRVLTRTVDLHYLAAFGNSIMADVARLDALAADQAKSDFISSISHELRTPLHGILASVEFLQDTALDLFQNNMIDTIKRCGATLLDTIQHVLDFANINNFTKSKVKGTLGESNGEDSQPRTMGLNVDIDLSVVIEDVVDSVYVGHEFHNKSSRDEPDEATRHLSEGLQRNSANSPNAQKQSVPKKKEPEVIMDIDWRANWIFSTQPGALKRILINLLGNSLKYTDTGWVKISLQSNSIKPIQSHSQKSIITITVSDTGRGMSQEFLHSHMFTPFAQEDSMNPGTGLGLSIVLQIVRSLGGTIDVKSEQGIGTEVEVSLTLAQVPLLTKLPIDSRYESSVSRAREMTSGLTLGLVGFGVDSSLSKTPASIVNAESEPSLYLQSSLERMATDWFDMMVTKSASFKDSPADIYIINEY
jgi:signal transduction histidine kinase